MSIKKNFENEKKLIEIWKKLLFFVWAAITRIEKNELSGLVL